MPNENRTFDKDYFQAFNDFNTHFVHITKVATELEKYKVLANKLSNDSPLESDKQAFAKLLKFKSYSEFEDEAKNLNSLSHSFYKQFSHINNENLRRLEMQDRIYNLIVKYPKAVNHLSSEISMGFYYNEVPVEYVDPYDNDGNEEEGGGADRCKNEYALCIVEALSAATYASLFCTGPQAPVCLVAVSLGYAVFLVRCYNRLVDCRKNPPQ